MPMSTPGVSFATPAVVLGTAAAAGAATTTIRSDSTLAAFDATVPTTIASGASAAAGSAAVAARRDHTHGVPTLATAPIVKYKTATQVFTTDITPANIVAASGNFAFAIGANEVWVVRFVLQLSFGGTGGVRLQLTGPSSPTAVAIMASLPLWTRDSATLSITSPTSLVTYTPTPIVTAFSSLFVANNSGNSATDDILRNNVSGGASYIYVDAVIANGANAGTVTLQGAQNSSNSTTTFGLGCSMVAQRAA